MKKFSKSTLVWGIAAGGICASLAIFGPGWSVTGMWARENAKSVTQAAVTESLARICVAQYELSSNKDDKLAALMALNTWERGNYVGEQGWATIPGSDYSTSRVADECARMLTTAQG